MHLMANCSPMLPNAPFVVVPTGLRDHCTLRYCIKDQQRYRIFSIPRQQYLPNVQTCGVLRLPELLGSATILALPVQVYFQMRVESFYEYR
jgi:hypothetical protein